MRIALKHIARTLALGAALLAFGHAPAQAAAKIQRVISPGGIEAWLVQDATVPLVAMQFAFRGGSAQDPADKPGVAQLMADNLDEPFSAVQLAKAAGLSVRQVERLFLRHLNMTPGRYYMRLRLERARELLRQTNLPILDVAIATGFTSHSYFAQSYRLQFGRPPSEERRTTY